MPNRLPRESAKKHGVGVLRFDRTAHIRRYADIASVRGSLDHPVAEVLPTLGDGEAELMFVPLDDLLPTESLEVLFRQCKQLGAISSASELSDVKHPMPAVRRDGE